MQKYTNQIATVRKDKGLSQSELARRSGINPSTISRLESGDRKITQEFLMDISKALGVDPMDLVGGYASSVETRYLIEIKGICSGTAWRAHGFEMPEETIPVVPAFDLRSFTHTAHRVEDDHAADLVGAGGFVISVPLSAMRKKALDGDWLVVKQIEGRMERSIVRKAFTNGPNAYVEIDGKDHLIHHNDRSTEIVVATYRGVI